MGINELKKLDQDLDKLLQEEKMAKKAEEDRAMMAKLMGDQVTKLTSSLLQDQKEVLTSGMSSIVDKIGTLKLEKPNITIPELKAPKIPDISIPDVKVDIDTTKLEKTLEKGLQGLKMPSVKVPKANVNVSIPDFPEIPNLEWPEGNMPVKLDGVSKEKPLPVQLRNDDGSPMKFPVMGGSSGGGGKSGPIKNESGYIDSDNPLNVSMESDIQIGAVEIKDHNSDARCDVITHDGYNALSVLTTGHVDDDNSSTSTLGAGATFTGTAVDITHVAVIMINVFSNVASAADGLAVEWSSDGTNWDGDDKFTIPAGTQKTFSFQPVAQYYRVKYTNGAGAQGAFRLQTLIKHTYIKPSSHRIADAIIDDDDAELVKSVITGKTAGGTFIDFGATNGGNFKVSLEELESGVSSNSNSQLNITQFDSNGNEVLGDTWAMIYDEDGGGAGISYQGWAAAGTATSVSSWRIRRIDTSSSPDVTIDWADGDCDFDNEWDNRASLSYS